jgi:galactitol-specific phosphotransferase system IIB component
MANKYNVRSISLPSRSHPSTIRVDEELNKLKTWEGTSTSTSRSIHNGLSLLEDLYISLDDLFNMTSTKQVISNHRGEKCIEEVLDGSMMILDICGTTRDTMLQVKENVQALHSSLRRRKSDSSVEKSVVEYKYYTKNMKKNVNKLITSLKHMDSKFGVTPIFELDHHLSSLVRVLREVIAMNLSIFQLILSFFIVSSSKSKSKSNKWLLVAKLMHKGTITSEDNSESVNELQCVEAALSTLLSEATCGEKLQVVHEKLKTLENAIESIEDGLENIFRRLIKTRSSLLNIISQ